MLQIRLTDYTFDLFLCNRLFTKCIYYMQFQYKVTVQKMGIISHLCTALSQLTQISPEKVSLSFQGVYTVRCDGLSYPDTNSL